MSKTVSAKSKTSSSVRFCMAANTCSCFQYGLSIKTLGGVGGWEETGKGSLSADCKVLCLLLYVRDGVSVGESGVVVILEPAGEVTLH